MNRLLVVSLAVFAFLTPQLVYADTLVEAGTERDGFDFPLGDPDQSTYDGPGYHSFEPFGSSELFELGSFVGQEGGSLLQFFMLSEVAAFDGFSPENANQFGVLNSSGDFTSLIDTAVENPLATASMYQAEDEELTVALNSPEGLFSSEDKDNPDSEAHILGMVIEEDGTITYENPTLRNSPAVTFDVLVGDIVLFIEDMLAQGNQIRQLVPEDSDFDYNDMVVVARQTQVPEPATAMLLGLALVGLGGARRRSRIR